MKMFTELKKGLFHDCGSLRFAVIRVPDVCESSRPSGRHFEGDQRREERFKMECN